MGKGCKIIHQDCDPTLCQDRSLPYTAYMVEYLHDGMTHFDIVSAGKKVGEFTTEELNKYKNTIPYLQEAIEMCVRIGFHEFDLIS